MATYFHAPPRSIEGGGSVKKEVHMGEWISRLLGIGGGIACTIYVVIQLAGYTKDMTGIAGTAAKDGMNKVEQVQGK